MNIRENPAVTSGPFRKACLSALAIFFCLGQLLQPADAVAGGTSQMSRRVDRLAAEYGSVLYAAIHSLPPLRDGIPAARKHPAWQGYRPDTLPIGGQRASDLKRALKAKLASLDRGPSRDLLRRLEHWCALEAMLFSGLKHYSGYSLERQMAVFLSLSQTQGLFEVSVKARGLQLNTVNPVSLAASLSSQEMIELSYSVLDALSALPEDTQLDFVADFFARWPTIRWP